jgi:LAO/AO transport system kinase
VPNQVTGHDREEPADLADRVRAGDVRALARVLTIIEDGEPRVRSVAKELAPLTTGARVIGLTGAPGAGKSTLTAALTGAFRERGERVGVLAVDPTSPFSGGALLGDRVRMQQHATDSGVFIRSMASRGHLGGLAAATPQAIRALDAAGFGVILVETVGVGQAEVEIAAMADTTVVLVVPGMGDSVQAAKAGLLEIADVFVVNKADRPETQETLRDLRTMIALSGADPDGWKPPIEPTVAVSGEGVDELMRQLGRHGDWLAASGEGERRRRARARDEVLAMASAAAGRHLAAAKLLADLAARVADGRLGPYEAADELLGTAGLPPLLSPNGRVRRVAVRATGTHRYKF